MDLRRSKEKHRSVAGSIVLVVLGATILLGACRGEVGSPTLLPVGETPTPRQPSEIAQLSTAEREALVTVAQGHEKIEEAWEQFHSEFDQWREGLISCDAVSLRVSLSLFASDFAQVTGLARSLPRDSSVRGMADTIISSAEEMERAIRALRDGWQPGDTGLFEAVEVMRASASASRKQVENGLLDLRERVSESTRTSLEEFASSFDVLSAEWDAFHEEYETLRTQQATLGLAEIGVRLNQLVASFGGLVVQVRDLPTFEQTREVGRLLIDRIEQEDLALRKLRDALAKTQEDQELAKTQEDQEEEAEPSIRTAFEGFDADLVGTHGVRRQAAEVLADLRDDSSLDSQTMVASFSASYDRLLISWRSFDQRYYAWRRTEGGCDRLDAIDNLAQFVTEFGQIVKDVRDLPRLQIIEPFDEILVEAVEREQRALNLLRGSWQPFDVTVYDVFDQDRRATGQLRRQVAVGLNELMIRYEVSLDEGTP